MNDRLEKQYNDFERAYENLRTGAKEAKTELEIDGVIKRFELCYEISWKLIKTYLEYQGIICKTPRICFKEAFNNDLINNVDTWLKMIDDRNLLVHTYTFEQSRKIFEHINEEFLNAFKNLKDTVKKRLSEEN